MLLEMASSSYIWIWISNIPESRGFRLTPDNEKGRLQNAAYGWDFNLSHDSKAQEAFRPRLFLWGPSLSSLLNFCNNDFEESVTIYKTWGFGAENPLF